MSHTKPKTSPNSVYILHGWTQDVTRWTPCLKLLKQAGLKHKFLKIPGLTTTLDRIWDLNDYVQWFSNQVGSDTNITIIGHSFGGRIAIRYAVTNPGQVKKLILIDSAGIRPNNIMSRLKRASFQTIAKIGKRITTNAKARQLLYSVAGEQDYHQANQILAQTMVKVISDDQKSEIPFIKSHTLIIWGRDDKTTPLNDGRYMNHHITGSCLKIIDGARHSPQYTHPEIVAQHIQDFLTNAAR